MSKDRLFIFDTTLRDKAREDKDYAKSDLIRNELLDKGVLIEDKNGKTVWKFK